MTITHPDPGIAPGRSGEPAELVDIEYTINGQRVRARVEPRRLLVHHLREDQLLTGTHVGCDTSQCGACAVRIDGRVVKSCSVLACQVDGTDVTTIEGITSGRPGQLHPVQDALARHHGLQCGFCTPGMVMTATEMLGCRRELADHEVRHGLVGNICRCTGYQNIVEAIKYAANKQG
jgi:carbon-monoxide dehydrogenase small subunit